MNPQKSYFAEIQTHFPDLFDDEVVIKPDAGQYNDILLINDEIVFRFPKFDKDIKTIITEIKILKYIRDQVRLPVPNPIYSQIHTNIVGQVFMGYPLIPGEPLWRHVFNSITDETILDRFASQLAGFLADLHTIPLEGSDLDLPIEDQLDQWKNLYTEIQEKLFDFMYPEARKAVTSHFEDFFTTADLHTFVPAIRHGDFGSTNILYDPKKMAISGIIDFGFAGVGDPAIDLAAVSTFGDSFFKRIRNYYPLTDRMLNRARFYKGTYALYEALYGFDNNDKAAFDAGMKNYVS
jgi:aminoglycoside 2''-phosphotransferase